MINPVPYAVQMTRLLFMTTSTCGPLHVGSRTIPFENRSDYTIQLQIIVVDSIPGLFLKDIILKAGVLFLFRDFRGRP
jgi:hypothetical protein